MSTISYATDICTALVNVITQKGLLDNKGVRNCRNPISVSKVADGVEKRLLTAGLPADRKHVIDAMANYAPSLAKSWHQFDIMSQRIFDAYIKALAAGYKGYEPGSNPGDETSEGPKDGEGGSEGDSEDSEGGDSEGDKGESSEDSGDADSEGESGGDSEEEGSEDGSSEGDSDGDPEGDSEGDSDKDSEGDSEDSEGSPDKKDEDSEGEDEDSEDSEDSEDETDGEDGEDSEDSEGDPEDKKDKQSKKKDRKQPPAPHEYIKPKEYEYVKLLLSMGYNVFLEGPAGAGKTDMTIRIFDELGKELHMISAPPMAYDVLGFIDAHGVYRDTAITSAFRDGGGLLIDEIDRSGAEALIPLNGGLANDRLNTPAGLITKNPDLVIVATGNTAGMGATEEYITAQKLDSSTLDRFVVVHVDYDENIDLACAGGDEELVAFARTYRKATKLAGVMDALCSYRTVSTIHKLDTCGKRLSMPVILRGALIKEKQPADTLQTVVEFMSKDMDPKDNRFLRGLKTLITQLRKEESQ